MPGMATQDEMDKLKSLHGKESDIYFLQLMIRHHQGGAPMMAYAQEPCDEPGGSNFAAKMLVAQTGEIQTDDRDAAACGASRCRSPRRPCRRQLSLHCPGHRAVESTPGGRASA